MELQLYHYKAIVTEVYDGDTCTVSIDLGLHTWINGERIRLARINAPEMRGEQRKQGLKSRDFLSQLILDKQIILQTISDKKGKYGRYLGEIWVQTEASEWINVNDYMVEQGYAIYAEY